MKLRVTKYIIGKDEKENPIYQIAIITERFFLKEISDKIIDDLSDALKSKGFEVINKRVEIQTIDYKSFHRMVVSEPKGLKSTREKIKEEAIKIVNLYSDLSFERYKFTIKNKKDFDFIKSFENNKGFGLYDSQKEFSDDKLMYFFTNNEFPNRELIKIMMRLNVEKSSPL